VVRRDRERSGKLTVWPRSRGAGDRKGQGVDGENPDDEEGESGFEEHDDMECREEEQITTAPGLKFGEVGEKNWGELHSGLRKLGSAPQPLLDFL